MSGFWPVYKRELKTYLQSPSTYVVLALLFFVVGYIFFFIMRDFSERSMRSQMSMMGMGASGAPNVTEFVIKGVFGLMNSLMMFTIPLLSMRLISEEKARGTFELLVTCPVSDWGVLLGKYFSLLTVGLAMVVLSFVFPALVAWLGHANQSGPEWPIVASCWIGLFLIFSAYAAFGVMASSFSENQMTAGVLTMIGLILWHIIGGVPSGELQTLSEVLKEISASTHTENFNAGVLMLKDFVFYILTSFLFLFIASKTLDARRWRI